MSSPLVFGSIQTPGALGLSAENSALATDPRIALVLDNAVYDSQGRICARKGWAEVTTTGSHASATDAIFEYVKDNTTKHIVSAGGGSLYSGTTTLTDITGALTPADDDWLFMNYNGKCVGVQAGETPIVWSGTGNFAAIVAGSGSLPTGNAGLSAWGRLWITDSDEKTIKFCAVLDETDWGGAGAGSLDTAEVWPDGLDTVIALAEWQDRLIIFGQRSILVYTGAEDPTASTFVLEDIIHVGCAARDSVAAVANDLVWVAVDGLRGLRRAIEYSNLPQDTIAPAVRQAFVDDVSEAIATPETIRGAYSRADGFYLCKVAGRYWCFDMRQGQARASKWTGSTWTSAHCATDGTLYFGQVGVVGRYDNYSDDGSGYEFRYRSAFLDLAEGREVFPKTAKATITSTGDYVVTASTAFDYSGDEALTQYAMPTARVTAEWQPADVATTSAHEWGTAEWSGGSTSVRQLPFDLSGAGSLVQVGLNVNINGYAFCLQRIDITSRLGRIAA